MPEYGRNIQSMVDYCLTIPDRTERTSCAATIVKVIINLFPKIKEDDNYKQKVWDHLALMSGFQLDVDAPYPLPRKQEASQPVATHIDYPMTKIRNRAYGSLVQRMIDKAVRTSNEFERLQIVAQTALYMKKQVLQNGKDSNAEDRVVADIEELSNGVTLPNLWPLCLKSSLFRLSALVDSDLGSKTPTDASIRMVEDISRTIRTTTVSTATKTITAVATNSMPLHAAIAPSICQNII